MVKLEVLERYVDIEFNRVVDKGETIEVSPLRYSELQTKEKEIGRKFFEEVKEETEQKNETNGRRKTTPSKK